MKTRYRLVTLMIMAAAVAILNFGPVSLNSESSESAPGDQQSALLQILRWEKSLRQVNDEIAGEFFAEDWVVHDPHLGNLSGIDGYIEWVRWYQGLMPDDFRYYVDDRRTMDNLIAVMWTMSGTHSGEVQDITPTENYIVLSGILFHRFESGKMAETWIHYDRPRFLFQIGLREIEPTECEMMARGGGCV